MTEPFRVDLDAATDCLERCWNYQSQPLVPVPLCHAEAVDHLKDALREVRESRAEIERLRVENDDADILRVQVATIQIHCNNVERENERLTADNDRMRLAMGIHTQE